MDGCIRGAMVCPIGDWRTMGKWNGTTIRRWNQWGRWRAARVPMGTMIWPAMSGSGQQTGMGRATTRAAQLEIRKGLKVEKKKWCEVGTGFLLRGVCASRIGMAYL